MLGKSKLKKNTVDENPEKVDEIDESPEKIDKIDENIDEPKNVKPVKKTTNVQTKSKG
jgi:hypothetical protein